MMLLKERKKIIETGQKMLSAGLTTGTGGNLSCFNREKGLIAITPSGIEYPDMTLEQVLVMTIDGKIIEGSHKPSSETGFHLGLYHKRSDVNAVVHTHSVYATTYACLNRDIPAVHYLVGFAGRKVPLAPYATYGSKELSDNITRTIENYNAVLMANHGLVAVGTSLLKAFNTAEEIELVARVSYQAESIGIPVILSNREMDRVIERFAHYGPEDNGSVP
ncbi:MAG: L-fuculose-phosphate aldolase [Desulfobacteraceae bacterium]